MDIRQLRYFVRITELGSLSRAASFLNVNQPTLSRHIGALEQEAGGRLLTRNGRGVTLTRAGEVFVEHARAILREHDAAIRAVTHIGKGMSGKVTLGMPEMMSTALTLPLIRRLRTDLPGAEVAVVHGNCKAIQEGLLSRDIDVAIMSDPPGSPMFEQADLIDVPIWLIGRSEYLAHADTIGVSDLIGLPMITGSRSNTVRIALERELKKLGAGLNIVLEIDAFDSRIGLAEEGLGNTVASSWSLQKHGRALHGVVARPIDPGDVCMKVKIVTLTNRTNSRAVDTTIGILEAVCPDLLSVPYQDLMIVT